MSQGQPFVRVRGWPIGSAQVLSDNVHKWRRTVPQGRERPTTPFRRALSWAAALVHIRPWNEDKAHGGRLGRAGHIHCGPRCTVCATVWPHFSSGGASCCGLSSGWDIGIPRPPCETTRTPSRSRTKPSPTTSTRCWGERDRSDMLGRRRGCTPSTTAIVAAKSQSTTSLTGYPPGVQASLVHRSIASMTEATLKTGAEEFPLVRNVMICGISPAAIAPLLCPLRNL